MNAKSFHMSVQGASHKKINKVCQDSSASYYDDECAVAVVCDGHGGNDYVRSRLGAEFAGRAALENIKSFIREIKPGSIRHNEEALLKQLEASIINDWNEAVYAHFRENPFTKKELSVISERAKRKYLNGRIESAYGTTLIAAAITPEFWFGIQIGDGKCVAVNPEGKFLQPIPWNDKCFLNATTSICDSNALENFRHFYSERLPIAVFAGSDGVDDSFKNKEQLHNLYKTVLYSFLTTDFDTAVDDLKDYLPRLSAKGSGDDISVSAVIDLERINDVESVREFDREREKSKVEEAGKAEAKRLEEERIRAEKEYKSAAEAEITEGENNAEERSSDETAAVQIDEAFKAEEVNDDEEAVFEEETAEEAEDSFFDENNSEQADNLGEKETGD